MGKAHTYRMTQRVIELTLAKRRIAIAEDSTVRGNPTQRNLNDTELVCQNQNCGKRIILDGDWVVSKPSRKNFARYYHRDCAKTLNII